MVHPDAFLSDAPPADAQLSRRTVSLPGTTKPLKGAAVGRYDE